MKRKIFAIVMSSLLLALGLMSACKNAQDGDGQGASSNGNLNYTTEVDTVENDEHFLDESKRLHRKTITEVNRAFVQNGKTDYVVIVGKEDSDCNMAVSFFSSQVRNCTGAVLKVYEDTNQDFLIDDETVANRAISYDSNKKYIVFSHEAMEEQANVQWATDVDLAHAGYMYKTVGNTLFVKVASLWGYQPVSLSLCREILGYEWYSEDTIVYTKDGSTLPNMDVVERPDMEFPWITGVRLSANGKYAAGVPYESVYAGLDGHNTLKIIAPEKYNDPELVENYHPLWFATANGETTNVAPKQLCYTAHGDKEEYEKLIQTVYEGLMKNIDDHPKAVYVIFTRMDEFGNCACATCNAIEKTCGTLNASILMFNNDISDMIQAELQRRADETGTQKREMTLFFSAYQDLDDAPMKGTEVGKYEYYVLDTATKSDGTKVNVINLDGKTYELPYRNTYENGLKMKPEAGISFAPIYATFEESMYHQKNVEFRIKAEKWGLLSEHMNVWLYNTNHDCYNVPFKSFDSCIENARFFANFGVGRINYQSQYQKTGTGFDMFKNYLTLTIVRDVNVSAKELTDKYFKNYFGVENGAMRQYYESLVAYMKQLEVNYPKMFYTAYKNYTDKPDYWPLSILQNWLDLCDQAYKEVEHLKTSDPERYALYSKHIMIETLFPRYMICEYYTGYYTNAEVIQMRQDFYNDCQEVELNMYNEFAGYSLDVWFEKWGVA